MEPKKVLKEVARAQGHVMVPADGAGDGISTVQAPVEQPNNPTLEEGITDVEYLGMRVSRETLALLRRMGYFRSGDLTEIDAARISQGIMTDYITQTYANVSWVLQSPTEHIESLLQDCERYLGDTNANPQAISDFLDNPTMDLSREVDRALKIVHGIPLTDDEENTIQVRRAVMVTEALRLKKAVAMLLFIRQRGELKEYPELEAKIDTLQYNEATGGAENPHNPTLQSHTSDFVQIMV